MYRSSSLHEADFVAIIYFLDTLLAEWFIQGMYLRFVAELALAL